MNNQVLKNQKGMSAVMVLMIIAVLSILSMTLIKVVFSDYKNINRYALKDKAYTACDQAVDIWRKEIELLFSDPFIGDHFDRFTKYAPEPEQKKEFLVSILDQVVRPNLSGYDNLTKPFEITLVVGNHDVKVKMLLDLIKISRDQDQYGENLVVRLGMYTIGEFDAGTINIRNTRMYEEFDLKVKVPESMQLLSPIFSIGDLYVNNARLEVNGDVNVFGTYPRVLGTPHQNAYGGIMARNYANVRIKGNAISRSAVRVGDYSSGDVLIPDNTTLRVDKDIIAQNIFAFGDNTEIFAFGNAMTFDDAEITGQDSVIAINGSYVGLEKGGVVHDLSSGLVNTALVHHLNSDDAKKSRIVINGDVIIPGSIVKINGAGETVAKIEDAGLGLITASGAGIPFYKLFPFTLNPATNSDNYHDQTGVFAGSIVNTYKSSLQGGSYLIGIQVFNPKSIGDYSNWRDQIQIIRKDSHEPTFVPSLSYTQAYGTDKSAASNLNGLSGMFNYEVAANGKLYYNKYNLDLSVNPTSPLIIQHLNDKQFFVNSSYKPMNLAEQNDVKSQWNDFWDLDSSPSGLAYKEQITAKVDALKEKLLRVAEPMISRQHEPPYTAGISPWKIDDSRQQFRKMLHALDHYASVQSNSNFKVNNSSSTTSLSSIVNPGGHSATTPYQLVYMRNPDSRLVVDGAFKGIIVSHGQIELKNADVWGAIVSFAGSTNPTNASIFQNHTNLSDPSFGRINLNNLGVDPNYNANVGNVEAGRYAGIDVFSGNNKIDFFCNELSSASGLDQTFINQWGRKQLLEKMNDSGLHLNHIF